MAANQEIATPITTHISRLQNIPITNPLRMPLWQRHRNPTTVHYHQHHQLIRQLIRAHYFPTKLRESTNYECSDPTVVVVVVIVTVVGRTSTFGNNIQIMRQTKATSTPTVPELRNTLANPYAHSNAQTQNTPMPTPPMCQCQRRANVPTGKQAWNDALTQASTHTHAHKQTGRWVLVRWLCVSP